MLIDDVIEEFQVVRPVYTDDGQGGRTIFWRGGETFRGALVKDTSSEVVAAEKAGEAAQYTLTIKPPSVRLDYHAVIKRLADGQAFRCISSSVDSEPPARASFSFAQARCERWEAIDE